MIRLSSPSLTKCEEEAVCRVLRSHIINMGTETLEFEKELASFWQCSGQKSVICVNSGTAALHLSLQACGVGLGDEVLAPTYTFVATFQAISATGAVPIPVDVDKTDGFIDLDDLQKRITSKTKAIVPVLFAGCGGEKISDLYNIAKLNNLHVIEDAAHCFGDEHIMSRSGILCFSFDAIKNITCSDGGCIVTDNDVIAEKIKDARLLGVIGDTEARYHGRRSWDADTTDQGWRYHMSNVCAAIGRAQLSRFDELSSKRKKYSKMYVDGLQDIIDIQLFPIKADTAVPHIFPIIIKDDRRDALKAFLYEQGIETGVQYKPNHLLTKFYKGYDLPNAMWLYTHILSLPLHPALEEKDIAFVVDKIRAFFNE